MRRLRELYVRWLQLVGLVYQMRVSGMEDLEECREECVYWWHGQGQLLSGFEGGLEGVGSSLRFV